MLQWQEHHKIKQAKFLQALQSFTAQKTTWLKAAELIQGRDLSQIGYIVYAREHAAMVKDIIRWIQQHFKDAGYAHVLCWPEGELLAEHLLHVHDGKMAMYEPMTVQSDEQVIDSAGKKEET